ncbi:MAG TPA: class I SAM-dependent methyltransferase [Polyangiales bacterium]|nr:class I SAM-dependent methyltransferase [Polyangiales bacterium]
MKRETVLALNALNHAFYAAIAPEFHDSRSSPWPGFARLLELVPNPSRVLDAGAGDGRFGAFLHERAPHALDYLGLDASQELLAFARARGLGSRYRFEHCDFIAAPESLPPGPFDLIVVLGVLHHVPSFEGRSELIRQLAQLLAAAGTLALTFWRLDRDPRFSRRLRSFAEYNARAAQPIDERDLEPGDQLLGWGDDGPPRYCHFPDARETEALLAAAGWPVCARFSADGRGGLLNDYVLLRRP